MGMGTDAMKSDSGKFVLLVVDDNEHNRFTLRTLVRKYLDVEILEAASGMEAVELALHAELIDLIVLDVQMPEMDGYQTASMLKIRKKTRNIPIIFLTAAYRTREFQQKGYEVGAVDYLIKPIDDNQLINKISTYLRIIEKERSANRLLEVQVRERTAELARAKQYLENILTYMGEALLVLNPQGVIVDVNPAACRMLAYERADLLGRSIGDVFQEESQEQAAAFLGTWLEALIRSGVIANIEASFIRRDGGPVPILFSRSAMYAPGGALSAIICIAKDMTEYKRMERALVEGLEE